MIRTGARMLKANFRLIVKYAVLVVLLYYANHPEGEQK